MKRLAAAWLAGMPAALLAQSAPPDGARAGAPAQTAQGDVAITIYANDLALVQDRREIDLPTGVSRQEFRDVSSRIRPETVRLSVADAEIVEQNYDYDLLSPEALMEKAVGQTITIVRTNPASGAETRERAQVLADNEGVILKIGDRIEVLREDGLPVRVVFDSLPPNLRARPTLSITLDSKRTGRRPATLSYLTGGLGWRADYVALFDEAKSAIDVQGWVTLTSNGDTRFDNADVVLVAGQPGGSGNGSDRPRPRGFAPGSAPGTESPGRERLGDYYLYPLGHRTAIAPNQQKQVSFLSVGGVPARKIYRYRNGWLGRADDPQSAQTAYSFSSAKGGGLGDALPAGTVRVYVRDARGAPQFIGENAIDHTAMGSTLAIVTGDAFDVKVQPVVDKRERITSDIWEQGARYRITTKGRTETVQVDRAVTYWRTQMRYQLSNARDVPVTVEMVQAGLDSYWGDTRVPAESQPGTQRSPDERVWEVRVPANGRAELTVTFDTRY